MFVGFLFLHAGCTMLYFGHTPHDFDCWTKALRQFCSKYSQSFSLQEFHLFN